MKLKQPKKEPFMDSTRTMGFVQISKLGKAQQVKLDLKKLHEIAKTLGTLQRLGFESIVVTVEKDHPIIFGSYDIGIGISPLI